LIKTGDVSLGERGQEFFAVKGVIYVSATLSTWRHSWHAQLFRGKIPREQGLVFFQCCSQGKFAEDMSEFK